MPRGGSDGRPGASLLHECAGGPAPDNHSALLLRRGYAIIEEAERKTYSCPEAHHDSTIKTDIRHTKRIFVDRLWARGLTKEKAALDAWEKELAPSAELRKWYGHDSALFEQFSQQYREELDANPAAAEFAKKLAHYDGTVTLLYGAKDAEHCNAVVLKTWLEERGANA